VNIFDNWKCPILSVSVQFYLKMSYFKWWHKTKPCVRLCFTCVRLGFTCVRLCFTCVRLCFTCVRLCFTCVRLCFTIGRLGLWCLMQLKTIFQLYRDNVNKKTISMSSNLIVYKAVHHINHLRFNSLSTNNSHGVGDLNKSYYGGPSWSYGSWISNTCAISAYHH
jgi:hypothetical protein